jgi:hypothetical protein
MPMYLASKPNEPPIQYRHYRIDVSRVGRGWRASIYAPNATHPLADSPSNLEKSDKNEILTEAKRIIDAHLASTRGPRQSARAEEAKALKRGERGSSAT